MIGRAVSESHASELANTKMTVDMSSYHLNTVRQPLKSTQLPMASYGLQLTRQAEAPPSTLVDTESLLENRYTTIGKQGFVFRGAETAKAPAQQEQIEPAGFDALDPVASRDETCERRNFWRADVQPLAGDVDTPFYLDPRDPHKHVNTRQAAKDKCKSSPD